jgi:hypothetical protein
MIINCAVSFESKKKKIPDLSLPPCISNPYWTVFYRIKWALQDVSELGYLFHDKSSLHIIAWDLDVRDQAVVNSWMVGLNDVKSYNTIKDLLLYI